VDRRSRLTACAVVTLCAFLGACGERQQAADPPSTTTSTPTSTSSAESTEPTVPTGGGTETSPPQQDNRCTAGMLKGTIQPGDAGAGNRYATLVVTNTSGTECTLWGYGGLELLDAARNAMPTDVTRQPNPGPVLVRLPPGATAAKNLHWGVIPTGDEPVDDPCQPESTGLRVIPPDETEPFDVTFDFGSVCNKGHLETSAYYAY
jgi:hypothetical protein